MQSLKNKTVIITGASSGIGKACAEAFAKEGANLVLAARQDEILASIANHLNEKYQIKAIAVKCDVSQELDCKNLIQQALKSFERIDVLVNNAGLSMRALIKDLDLAVLKLLMDVNFWGTVYCTKYALPELLKAQGSVVGVSSVNGFLATPGRSGYSASKFAMNGFLESLRIENLKTDLHVLIVCPGFTATNIRNTALLKDGSVQHESTMNEAKMMPPEVVAEHILQGVLKRKRTIILGIGKLSFLLKKLVPAFLDKLTYHHFTKEKDPLI